MFEVPFSLPPAFDLWFDFITFDSFSAVDCNKDKMPFLCYFMFLLK